MIHNDEIRRASLRKEADQWIELEMETRMAAAAEEIATQADVGSNILPEPAIQKHVTDATRYAEQEIRRDLEMEADSWIERKMKEQAEFAVPDADHPCSGCRGCQG